MSECTAKAVHLLPRCSSASCWRVGHPFWGGGGCIGRTSGSVLGLRVSGSYKGEMCVTAARLTGVPQVGVFRCSTQVFSHR